MASVVFQVMSDLHLETHPSYNYKFKQTARYLALLGDIGHTADDGLFTFLEKQLNRYWVVFYLLGNHEPTHTSWPAAKQRVRQFEQRVEKLRQKSTIGKFVFLDQSRYDVNSGITVLGCTLFSNVHEEHVRPVSARLVDFKNILDWTVADHNEAYRSDVAWLNDQVQKISAEEPERQIVIFSHHCPTIDSKAILPAHAQSEVSSGFATDLSNEACWQSSSVVAWAFGHTHYNCDFTDEHGKKVFGNQKGYYSKPQSDFSAAKVFTIGKEISL